MTHADGSLPFVRRLPANFSFVDAFERLAELPGCLWLDSVSRGPRIEVDKATDPVSSKHASDTSIGRYSFLTADPIQSWVAFPGEANPWPILQQWCNNLPDRHDESLPPFQGGIAGLIGYEAASWLEDVGVAAIDDLPTPAMALGLYDWVLAKDHLQNECYLISQGIGSSQPLEAARQRADQVLQWCAGPIPDRTAVSFEAREAQHQFPTPHAGLTSNLSGEQYRERVNEIVRRIRDGDSFQVNFAQRLLNQSELASPELYLRLRRSNPAPFSAYYRGDNFQVLSSSPEGFLRVRDRNVQTRPIKGTAARTGDPQRDLQLATTLSASDKDLAENTMIVDLMRNDLSRTCQDDSVRVKQLCRLERYQYVQHLVSVVEGTLRDDANIATLLQTCFPGGSITGAPKIEAMRTIAELEPHRRGPYCGSIGYIGCGGSADFNILIRTITAAGGYWQIPVGGGITARSDAASEEAETWAKAEGMLQAIKGQIR